MPIFYGTDAKYFDTHNILIDKTQISTFLRNGKSNFPVVLELLDALRNIDGAKMHQNLVSTIAPKFDTVVDYINLQYSEYKWDQLPIPETNDDQTTVARMIGDCFARQPFELFVQVNQPHFLDASSKQIIDSLLKKGVSSKFCIWLNFEEARFLKSSFTQYASIASFIGDAPAGRVSSTKQNVFKVLLSTYGPMPEKVYTKFGGSDRDQNVGYMVGPNDEKWVFPLGKNKLSQHGSLEVLAIDMDALEFWSNHNWGYIYKAWFCSKVEPTQISFKYCLAVTQSLVYLSKTAAFQYLSNLTKHSMFDTVDVKFRIFCLATLGRLSTKSEVDQGYQRAESYLRQAISICENKQVRAKLQFHLANILANARTKESLLSSRKEYIILANLIGEIDDRDASFLSRIELLNGLALVEYHEGKSRQALRLEWRAKLLSDSDVDISSKLKLWSRQLINKNISTLLLKRFQKRTLGEALLSENFSIAGSVDYSGALKDYIYCLFDSQKFGLVFTVVKQQNENQLLFNCHENDLSAILMAYIYSAYRLKKDLSTDHLVKRASQLFFEMSYMQASKTVEKLIRDQQRACEPV